jgi:hypothetical protein
MAETRVGKPATLTSNLNSCYAKYKFERLCTEIKQQSEQLPVEKKSELILSENSDLNICPAKEQSEQLC